MIWKEKRVVLIVLALLLAANTFYFFTYRVQYESRLHDLESRREVVKRELEAARRTRVTAEQQLAAYRKIEKDIHQVYEAEWSTQNRRLTPFITEVMRLATLSKLIPLSYSFTGTATSKGTAKSPAFATANEVGIGFNVEGTYEQVRRLINLLEISDQFIIIDQVSLGSDSGDKLRMTIRVKTLFRDAVAAPRTSNQEL